MIAPRRRTPTSARAWVRPPPSDPVVGVDKYSVDNARRHRARRRRQRSRAVRPLPQLPPRRRRCRWPATTIAVSRRRSAPPEDGPPPVVVVDVGRSLDLGLVSPGDEVDDPTSAYWGPPTSDTGWLPYTVRLGPASGAAPSAALHWGGLEIVLSTNDEIGADGITATGGTWGPSGDHPEIVLVARNGLTIGSSKSRGPRGRNRRRDRLRRPHRCRRGQQRLSVRLDGDRTVVAACRKLVGLLPH